ncbi:hypothetical protein EYZ11_000928 [Aspergillus tanneri]|uniref:Uncharacterized protein n=1 Tax=Aspergillus tanneri TaxID=1220188 RepID=A0A4S3JVT3_9EURO|nr:hypothetical protein EYZ11_000928 [Aspergillus tanneri]
MPLIPDESSSVSHHAFSPPPERLVTRSTPSSTVHSRETSAVRGRPADPSTLAPSTLQPQNNRRGHSHSKSPETSTGRPSPSGYDAPLERRPSNSYGHHRQTSIVHGMQHSRNPSFAASTTSTSPLSPELIASLGRGGGVEPDSVVAARTEQADMHGSYQSPAGNSSSHTLPGTLSTIEDQDADEFVGQADNKINQAIMKLGESDAPVEQVCGPGADTNFDQLISALGHIARQKPKPLIDTIMFWRKAKGDAANGMAKQVANQPKNASLENGLLIRRNTEPPQMAAESTTQTDPVPPSNNLLSRHEDVVLAERRATVVTTSYG